MYSREADNMLQKSMTKDFFDIESIVEDAIYRLRNEFDNDWLAPEIFRSCLFRKIGGILEEHRLTGDWTFWVDDPIYSVLGIHKDVLEIKLGDYLGKNDMSGPGSHLYWLNGEFIEKNLQTPVGLLKPELVMRISSQELWVWDLSASNADEHMAKTILFADLLSNESQTCQIGEVVVNTLFDKRELMETAS